MAHLAGCGSDPEPPVEPPAEPEWQVVLDEGDLDRAVLSVSGAEGHVFAAGGGLGNTPYEALALRFDGSGWQELDPGGTDSFWWVHARTKSDVWMVGEHGRIAHFDGTRFEAHAALTDATLFGVFAMNEREVWAVGGTPRDAAGEQDVLLHYDGQKWTVEDLPDKGGVALYKVWASGPDDIYIVGDKGTIYHRKAGAWSRETSPIKTTLFTVAGCGPTEIYVAGGSHVLQSAGDGSWTQLDIDLGNQAFGVSCGSGGQVAVVGAGGLKQRLLEGAWVDEFNKPPFADLHATWVDPEGVVWVAGGEFVSPASPNTPRAGVVGRFGVGSVSGSVAR